MHLLVQCIAKILKLSIGMHEYLQFIDHLLVLFGYTVPRLFQPVDGTIDECGHDLQDAVEVSQVSTDVGHGA